MPWLRNSRLLESGWLPIVAIALASGVLGGVVLLGKAQLRSQVREQITRRDAEVLYALSQMHQGGENDSSGSIEEPSEQKRLMVEISGNSSSNWVVGLRFFTPEGECWDTFPSYVSGVPDLDLHQLARLRAKQPVSVFRPEVPLDSVFDMDKGSAAPLLEVLVPLHACAEESRVVGIAQFIIAGQSIATEFAALDRNLNVQAALAFVAGTGVLVLGLGWAFHRLQRTNRLLKARTDQLVHANEELALALKTSAVGSVTSHLIHGLKNPLAGLQLFVATRGGGKNGAERWDQAEAAARRMNSMIYDVLELLRDQSEGDSCDVSAADLAGMVSRRTQAIAAEHRVEVLAEVHSDRRITSRAAQLSSLILVNLVENAVQATPAGKNVTLHIADENGGLRCEVRDTGAGIPADVVGRLFTPGRTTKSNGTGLGLALCKQLARHLGAELVLKANGPGGCVFALALPQGLLVEAEVTAAC